MANTHSTLSALFTDIAGAIREVDGSTEKIVADTFPDKIRNLSSGTLYQEVANLKLTGSRSTYLGDSLYNLHLTSFGNSSGKYARTKNGASIDLAIIEIALGDARKTTFFFVPKKAVFAFDVTDGETTISSLELTNDEMLINLTSCLSVGGTCNILAGTNSLHTVPTLMYNTNGTDPQYYRSADGSLGVPVVKIVAFSRAAV